MRPDELRPCDCCGGLLTGPRGADPVFYVVDVQPAVVNPRAITELMALSMLTGSAAIAQVMTPHPDVVSLGGDQHPELVTRILLCQGCYLGVGAENPLRLAVIAERLAEREAKPAEDDDGE